MQKDGSKFKKLLKEPEYQKIMDLLIAEKEKWFYLTEKVKVWFYFINFVLLPSKHLITVRKDKEVLLYALLKGYKINVGKIIETSIMSYFISNYRGLIPHPTTITSLCLVEGVEEEWGKEEMYPKASLLTLK